MPVTTVNLAPDRFEEMFQVHRLRNNRLPVSEDPNQQEFFVVVYLYLHYLS